MTQEEKFYLIGNVFSPSAPIDKPELFIGRNMQLEQIKDVIEERGQHAVMYGGRGVGKTSLANILSALYGNVAVSKITCNRSDSFESLWRRAVSHIEFVSTEKSLGFGKSTNQFYESLQLPEKEELTATDIENIFRGITSNLLFVFDEFDSIDGQELKAKMADTLKTLSDNVPQATVLVVGIGENVQQLIGEHASLERCIRQIEIPLMSEAETEALILNGMHILGLQIEPQIKELIVEYSSGFPHYTHALCKFAAKAALKNDGNKIGQKEFDVAVNESIKSSNQSLRTAYEKAVMSSRKKNQFEDVIFACILSAAKAGDSFTTAEVVEKYNKLSNREVKKESINYNLGMLCKAERGYVLEKVEHSRNKRYRLKNPLMKAFVKLKLHEINKNIDK